MLEAVSGSPVKGLSFPTTGAVAVFGGSGGAGSAICRAFAAAGCHVALTYHSRGDRAEELVNELSDAPGRIQSYQADVSDGTATRDVVKRMQDDFAGLHTVIYAAGPQFEFKNICDVEPAEFRKVVDAELIGFHNIAHATMPALRLTSGSLVACITYAIRRVLPLDGQSAVPKAGIESFVRQIAWEEAANGVRANSVGLGWLNFGLGEIGGGDRSMLQGEVGVQFQAQLEQMVPLGHRPGHPHELADPVLFFASDQASYVTGQTLMVDGGLGL